MEKTIKPHKFDDALMETAYVWAKKSYCTKRKVGAVISKDGTARISRFNGTVSGQPNNCEDEVLICSKCNTKHIVDRAKIEPFDHNFPGKVRYSYYCDNCQAKHDWTNPEDSIVLKTNDFTSHAEFNAITYAAKYGFALDGTEIHITTSPCKECSKLIASSGIKRVVYDEDFKDLSGVEHLKKLGIEVHKYSELMNQN
jgi:dCMP deaminase